MKNKILHIVSFDNPFPPNYGGVIDVFYKIKFLFKKGYSIILHIHTNNFLIDDKLKELCLEIYVYKRNNNLLNQFSKLPFRVKSRNSNKIFNNLKKDDYPILFEGIQTTYPLYAESFENRKVYLRAHNIEHNYYLGLIKSETNILKKLAFKFEAIKLRRYENKLLPIIDVVYAISNFEYDYYLKKSIGKSAFLPVFHENEKVKNLEGKGKYVLYQGDLKVPDNIRAVKELLNLFKAIDYPLIIAGNISEKYFDKQFMGNVSALNIRYEKIIDSNHLLNLFKNAHINALFSFQNTGTKLKLINALYNSRFCLINDNMVDDRKIKKLCIVENDLSKYKEKIEHLISIDYNESSKRNEILADYYNEANQLF